MSCGESNEAAAELGTGTDPGKADPGAPGARAPGGDAPQWRRTPRLRARMISSSHGRPGFPSGRREGTRERIGAEVRVFARAGPPCAASRGVELRPLENVISAGVDATATRAHLVPRVVRGPARHQK